MKKLSIFIITLLMTLSIGTVAFADDKAETTVDASQPRLMVTSYKLDGDSVSPDKNSTLEITIKNFSSTKSVRNIKLSLLDESGEIKADGTGTQFVERIYSGSTYTWSIPIVVSKTAQIGEHKLSLNMEYEDKYYTAYSSSDTLIINVKQSVSLDYDGILLPAKATQNSTETISPVIMNTGKSTIRNCKITFDIEGLNSGGTVFIGEIPASESKTGTANLRVSSDMLGKTKGTATITYEDEFGESYSKTADLSTTIVEPVVQVEEAEEEQKKYPLWWAFALAGLTIGGTIGFIIPTAIHAKKQRKEDEMRL